MSFEPVLSILQKNGISLAGAVIDIPNTRVGIFIPAHVNRSSDGTLSPAKKAFLLAKQQIELIGYEPEFLFVNERTEDAEHSLRSSLLVNFPETVRNVFLSVDTSRSNVWVDQKRFIEGVEWTRIEDHVLKSLQLFRLPPPVISSLSQISLPTRFELLAVIRLAAPVDCEALRNALIERDLTVPSLDWINRQFDLLRKSGLIVRRGDRHYVLTLDALQRLGTRKDRRSPDVQRLLALAKGRV